MLSPIGRAAQARQAGEALRTAGAQAVLHGSRRRAIQTAHLIAESLADIDIRHSEWLEHRRRIPDDSTSVPRRYHERLREVPPGEADQGARMLSRAVDALSSLSGEDCSLIAVTHTFVIG
jgi:broad specificity phosphatase PhoE